MFYIVNNTLSKVDDSKTINPSKANTLKFCTASTKSTFEYVHLSIRLPCWFGSSSTKSLNPWIQNSNKTYFGVYQIPINMNHSIGIPIKC